MGMETTKTNSHRRPSRGKGYAPLPVCIAMVLLMTAACSKGGDNSTPPPSSQAAGDDGFSSTMTAAISQGQFTLNNRWTQADLDYENIGTSISYEGANQPAGRMRPYTTLVQQYQARRKQCEADSRSLLAPGSLVISFADYYFQDQKCYPTLTYRPHGFVEPPSGAVGPTANQVLHRYGYYCGGGYPNFDPFAPGAPEPLDGVDYCCRLHDAQAWGESTIGSRKTECGIAMCLSKASGFPADVLTQMPDVEAARQFWYGGSVDGGAAFVCGGNQSNDAQPPILGP